MSILMTPAYLAATAYPLINARIGWENQARGAVITSSSLASCGCDYSPVNDQTWEWWQADNLPAWWAATFPASTVINYAAIGAHDIGSAGATVKIQYLSGGVWADVTDAVVTPADDSAIMILFENITCDGMRLYITGASGPPHIGVVHFGTILELTRPVRWIGHTPTLFQRTFEKRPNVSERGQRLGVSLIRQGLTGSFDVYNLDEHWTRDTFDLFVANSLRYGYFISWRPDQFPAEVYYGWSDKPIVPTNQRGGVSARFMSVSWAMDCYQPENIAAWES